MNAMQSNASSAAKALSLVFLLIVPLPLYVAILVWILFFVNVAVAFCIFLGMIIRRYFGPGSGNLDAIPDAGSESEE